MHFESYLRDVTGEMRSPWKLRCGVKRSQTVINVAQKLENTEPPGCHATVKTTQNIVEIPTVQEQMI